VQQSDWAKHLQLLLLLLLALVLGMAQRDQLWAQRAPTAQEYARAVGARARIVAAGELVIDGHKINCGKRPTVLDEALNDYGAAYPGFIILNPKLLEGQPTAVKLWTYAHECGHQFRGPDEAEADCFAIERGHRQGWLTARALEEVCRFISSAKASTVHFSGPTRCQAMRACYAGLYSRSSPSGGN
jgi:hypothetical protein